MFELATPWAFILLPFPWIIWRFLPALKPHFEHALRVPFFHQIEKIAVNIQASSLKCPVWLILTWILLVCALAGPRSLGSPTALQREGHHIMIALDISTSMALDDMVYQGHRIRRLDLVRYTAKQFIQKRTNDKIGLILFGSNAYLQTPLTFDKQTLVDRLEDATVGLAGQATAIGDAIALGTKHLQNTPENGRILILLTDGASNAGLISPQKASQLAKEMQVKIYTIGLASNPNQISSLFPTLSQANAVDEKTLRTIANITGGHAFLATSPTELMSIYKDIDQIETIKNDTVRLTPPHEYYPWILALALFVTAYGAYSLFRRSR